jgi:multidrug efflux pump subunit AcrB
LQSFERNLEYKAPFRLRLQDRAQKGYEDLLQAKDQVLAAAKASPILQDVYVEGLSPAPQVELIIDREKASALGVTFQDINSTISTNLGSAYVNDFPNRGRMQRACLSFGRIEARHSRLLRNARSRSRSQPPEPCRSQTIFP